MNKGIISVISIAFLLLPGIVYPQSEQTGPNIPPPVSQQLVPEGSFALKLAPALQLGTPESEIQAVDTLASVGIDAEERVDCRLSCNARYYWRIAGCRRCCSRLQKAADGKRRGFEGVSGRCSGVQLRRIAG